MNEWILVVHWNPQFILTNQGLIIWLTAAKSDLLNVLEGQIKQPLFLSCSRLF